MVKQITDTEAIKVYIMPRKNGITYNVNPPASLMPTVKKLPLYKECYHKTGFLLRSQGELLTWIEGVVKLKRQLD